MGSLDGTRDLRRWVRQLLAEAGASDDTTAVAELLSGELAVNAVRHAGSVELVARVIVKERDVTVSVQDPAAATSPVVRAPDGTDVGGRGMQLVDRLSAAWGTTTDDTSKWVWFQLENAPRRDERSGSG